MRRIALRSHWRYSVISKLHFLRRRLAYLCFADGRVMARARQGYRRQTNLSKDGIALAWQLRASRKKCRKAVPWHMRMTLNRARGTRRSSETYLNRLVHQATFSRSFFFILKRSDLDHFYYGISGRFQILSIVAAREGLECLIFIHFYLANLKVCSAYRAL